ncbi:hypothetical protein N7523_010939 [Penicillium sp. IBT 18751x]|nr:hypothetical protein N7523_010939 [Penicillium sp. IBT 18751x]
MTSKFVILRPVTVAVCQLGPIHLADSREDALKRMFKLLEQAAKKGVKFAVFPELAFTTIIPMYLLEGEDLDQYFEIEYPRKGGIEVLASTFLEIPDTTQKR